MDTSAKFWENIANRYANQPISDEAAYQTKLTKTREYLTPEAKVLEFGCGTGGTAVLHAPLVKQYHAIDIADNMLRYGREKATKAGLANVAFEQSTIEAFSAPEGSFDVVLGLSIVHLLRDPAAALSKVYALLKPGGVFVSSTVCIDETQPWLKYILRPLRLTGKVPFVQPFKIKQLEQLLKDAGFDIEHQWQPGKGKAVFIVARK